jgi:glycerol-3-phosphate acyltransferase PlsY
MAGDANAAVLPVMLDITLMVVLPLLAAYLIGSLPTGYLVARLRRGIDIRQVGSRNMGAMNVFYQVGFRWGLLVLSVDIGKGAAAVALVRFMGVPLAVELLGGAAVVLGHSFPVFLKYRGGKGGATTIGVLAYLMPWGIPVFLAIFGLLFGITRFPTLSYSLAFVGFPFIAWLVYGRLAYVIFAVLLLVLPGAKYVPRILEMRTRSGGWRHFFMRRGLKDRF